MSDVPGHEQQIDAEDWDACLRVLRICAEDPEAALDTMVFKGLVTKIARKARKQNRAREAERRRGEDDALLAGTARVQAVPEDLLARALETPAPRGKLGTLHRGWRCYVCRVVYREVDGHYHRLCPDCASDHRRMREMRTDLSGRRALITGGRIKIGFELACLMLRDGAEVTVTSRFPADAARRFRRQPNFEVWGDRLKILALDLRDLVSVMRLAEEVEERGEALDILVHNAAQTIKRPKAYFRELLEAEERALSDDERSLLVRDAVSPLLEGGGGPVADARASLRVAMEDEALFPRGLSDHEGLPVDLRGVNSWVQRLHEVEPVEVLEVFFVNAVAPLLLSGGLKPALLRSTFAERFIVNVSAMEGSFARESKTARHPHTNMAKAALNMMTRTSAQDLAEDGIYMNSVDTGWITDENPRPTAKRLRAGGFVTPLDVRDGAVRVYDPIVRGVEGDPVWGRFFKDFEETAW